eukprot:353509-Chlamydomonas_euryale.AAC.4
MAAQAGNARCTRTNQWASAGWALEACMPSLWHCPPPIQVLLIKAQPGEPMHMADVGGARTRRTRVRARANDPGSRDGYEHAL